MKDNQKINRSILWLAIIVCCFLSHKALAGSSSYCHVCGESLQDKICVTPDCMMLKIVQKEFKESEQDPASHSLSRPSRSRDRTRTRTRTRQPRTSGFHNQSDIIDADLITWNNQSPPFQTHQRTSPLLIRPEKPQPCDTQRFTDPSFTDPSLTDQSFTDQSPTDEVMQFKPPETRQCESIYALSSIEKIKLSVERKKKVLEQTLGVTPVKKDCYLFSDWLALNEEYADLIIDEDYIRAVEKRWKQNQYYDPEKYQQQSPEVPVSDTTKKISSVKLPAGKKHSNWLKKIHTRFKPTEAGIQFELDNAHQWLENEKGYTGERLYLKPEEGGLAGFLLSHLTQPHCKLMMKITIPYEEDHDESDENEDCIDWFFFFASNANGSEIFLLTDQGSDSLHSYLKPREIPNPAALLDNLEKHYASNKQALTDEDLQNFHFYSYTRTPSKFQITSTNIP